MSIDKFILAAVTTNAEKIAGGTAVFLCETKEEMEFKAANLEAILDGIAHSLAEDLFIIVKH